MTLVVVVVVLASSSTFSLLLLLGHILAYDSVLVQGASFLIVGVGWRSQYIIVLTKG
jgi:hypothetical protein